MSRRTTIAAVTGLVAGAALGALGGALGLAVGAIVGVLLGAGVALALGSGSGSDGLRTPIGGAVTGARIDPFTIGDPWRRLVQRALAARSRFDEAVGRTPTGPVRDRMSGIGVDLARSIDEVWATARAGHELSQAHRRLDVPAARRERDSIADDADPRAAALDAQLATGDRLGATIDDTRSRLELLATRLDEVVARSIELSVGAHQPDAFSEVESGVTGVSDELEALRAALAETSAIERGGTA